MLDAVLRAMQDHGLLRDAQRARCNVFVRLDNVLANVFAEDGRYYYVRMAEVYDLEQEYRIALSVAASVGRFVPQPLAFLRAGRVSCIVYEGIKFEIVTSARLLRGSGSDRLIRELLAYLSHAADRQTCADRPASVASLTEALSERYLGTEQESLIRTVAARTDIEALRWLPSQLQHGDFVPNNFGLRRDGLVVFDWEDFGRIDVPGFDLAVLLGAIVDFDPQRLRALRENLPKGRGRRHVRWLDDACRAARLEPDVLLDAMPFYLALFMWLKDRYSPAIRQKVNRAIDGLL